MDLLSFFGLDVVIYAVLAVICLKNIWKKTSIRLYRRLAVAFVILLPTWDVVLSSILFYAACPFVPKAAIYETAETDGIYYEGAYRDKVFGNTFPLAPQEASIIHIYTPYQDLQKGYKYFEALISAINDSHERKTLSSPQVYRCSFQGTYPQHSNYMLVKCSPAENIKSDFLVKSEDLKFLLARVHTLRIYKRSTGTLMAEYRDIGKEPYRGWTWAPVPFFNWLGFELNDVRHGGANCPTNSKYFNFQYDVLKVKKSL